MGERYRFTSRYITTAELGAGWLQRFRCPNCYRLMQEDWPNHTRGCRMQQWRPGGKAPDYARERALSEMRKRNLESEASDE